MRFIQNAVSAVQDVQDAAIVQIATRILGLVSGKVDGARTGAGRPGRPGHHVKSLLIPRRKLEDLGQARLPVTKGSHAERVHKLTTNLRNVQENTLLPKDQKVAALEDIENEMQQLQKESDHMRNVPQLANLFASLLANHLEHPRVAAICFEYLATKTLLTFEHMSHLPVKTSTTVVGYNSADDVDEVDLTRNLNLEVEVAGRLFGFLREESSERTEGVSP
jgi:hypothetical protein